MLGDQLHHVRGSFGSPGYLCSRNDVFAQKGNTLLGTQLIMQIVSLLVFDECLRMNCLPNVVVKGGNAQKERIEMDRFCGSLSQKPHGYTVIVSSRGLLNHVPNWRKIEVPQFQQADISRDIEYPLA